MEVDAILAMFKRSFTNFGVRFRNDIRDRDSKAYTAFVNSKPYGENFWINKKECIGHVQKWMGTRLRDLVKTSVVETQTEAEEKVKRIYLHNRITIVNPMFPTKIFIAKKVKLSFKITFKKNQKYPKSRKCSTNILHCNFIDKN